MTTTLRTDGTVAVGLAVAYLEMHHRATLMADGGFGGLADAARMNASQPTLDAYANQYRKFARLADYVADRAAAAGVDVSAPA